MNEIRALIIWHYYEKGKIVDYSTTSFVGDQGQLEDCIRSDKLDREKNKKGQKRIVILHQLLIY